MPTSTTALMNLATETNKIIIDAIAANNRRQVAYAKSVWGVIATPLPGNDLSANVSETIERAETVVDLTLSDLETTSTSAMELAERIAAQAAKAREESLVVARAFAERLDTLSRS